MVQVEKFEQADIATLAAQWESVGAKDSMSFASPGTGSAPHLVGELFKIVTGIPSVHVPYKGSGTAAPDLAAGNVQFMFDAIAGHQAFIQSGRTRALAVTSPARLAAFPDVPAMK